MSKILNLKLVFLGEGGVGKSSIALRFVNGEFNKNMGSTIGAAFLTKTLELDDEVYHLRYGYRWTRTLSYFDPMYYRGAKQYCCL